MDIHIPQTFPNRGMNDLIDLGNLFDPTVNDAVFVFEKRRQIP